MSYKIRKSLLGKYEVQFACSGCGEKIIFSLSDAGTQQCCPSCGTAQQVEGEAEKRKYSEAAVLAEEAARKQRIEEQARRERERMQAEEIEAARQLKESSEAQNLLELDQDAIRTADWADRRMWKAFGQLRQLFAIQLVFGLISMVAGIGALVVAFLSMLASLGSNPADHAANASICEVAGLTLIGFGYTLYLTAAMGATIVYIERNTRGILRN